MTTCPAVPATYLADQLLANAASLTRCADRHGVPATDPARDALRNAIKAGEAAREAFATGDRDTGTAKYLEGRKCARWAMYRIEDTTAASYSHEPLD